MRRLVAVIAAAAILYAPAAQARYAQTASVRTVTRNGSADWYKVDVNFLTGQELNTATRTINYDAFGAYAMVFWGGHQATVIALENTIICGAKFERRCVPSFGNLNGKDQEGREWEICTAAFCYS